MATAVPQRRYQVRSVFGDTYVTPSPPRCKLSDAATGMRANDSGVSMASLTSSAGLSSATPGLHATVLACGHGHFVF